MKVMVKKKKVRKNVTKKQNTKKIGDSMRRGFKTAKIGSTVVICKPSKGPIIKKRK